jgi:hypothetical protein
MGQGNHVAVAANLVVGVGNVDGTNSRGVWVFEPRPLAKGSNTLGPPQLHLVARTGSHAPDTPADAVFGTIIFGLVMNKSGGIALRADLKPGTTNVTEADNSCIWSGTGDDLKLVVREGSIAPVGNIVGAKFDLLNNFLMNDAGEIAFDAKGDRQKAQYFVLQVVSDDPAKWGDNKIVKQLAIAPPEGKK